MGHIKEIKESTLRRAERLHRKWVETSGKSGKKMIVTEDILSKLNTKKIKDFQDFCFEKVDFGGIWFSSKKIKNFDLSETDFGGANFRGAIFKEAQFVGINFYKAVFSDADFSGADFTKSNFAEAIFENVDFYNTKFVGVSPWEN